MSSIPGTVLQPAGPTRRRGSRRPPGRRPSWRAMATLVGGVLVGGVVLGIAWWWLAPTAVAQVQGSQVVLRGHQELQIAQDGWFAVVVAAAGVLLATVLALRPSRRPAAQALAAAAALAAASVVAWRVGIWLGPASFADQVAAGTRAPVTPLVLRTPAPLLLLGPLLFSITRFTAAVLTGDQEAGAPDR